MVSIVFRTVASAIILIALGLGSASAQEQTQPQGQRRNQPGEFDFYVLSLSWSPSFCRESEERGRSNEQCRGRP
jgi:ribonuclease T2